ncbi:unnamed protein product [Soboliphyme baturini]|uniref:Mediator of RNA polymerase II transcription subunit 19 n=1 Tax=Soboliphyme baturini TaxID=241478 RepID=A0A183IPM5_9BILA|nr:unnamed protein product [Soboliphyme baturini]
MEEAESAETSSPSRDSTGILRTKISLGRKPSVIMPFYLMKSELPGSIVTCKVMPTVLTFSLSEASSVTGNMNLLSYYGLDHAWNKFCNNKKLKEELSAFLPHLPGSIDTPAQKDGSSLRQLIEKPPICGKEILPLTNADFAGLKLFPGAVSILFYLFFICMYFMLRLYFVVRINPYE